MSALRTAETDTAADDFPWASPRATGHSRMASRDVPLSRSFTRCRLSLWSRRPLLARSKLHYLAPSVIVPTQSMTNSVSDVGLAVHVPLT
jgi:hypothetical protein